MMEMPWCLSGGAIGADRAWGVAATAQNHTVTHFSADNRVNLPVDQICVLSAVALAAADPACCQANRTLQRTFPARSQQVTNLIRRNWYQVNLSDSCYAISELTDGKVKGGTAWAVQMFLDRHDNAACAAYVFDQVAGFWTQWNGTAWERIHSPPMPKGIWAGIGRRKLNLIGRLAINVLMDYWPRGKNISEKSSR